MISLRPSGFDELGLRRALADRMLPLLVAAMAFLAALAIAFWFGAAALSQHWRQGAGSALTVQVPRADQPALAASAGAHPLTATPPDGSPAAGTTPPAAAPASVTTGTTRLAAALAVLAGTPGVASAHALTDRELNALLKPWIGADGVQVAIPIPAVIAVRLTEAGFDPTPLNGRLQTVAPGTLVEDHGIWIGRLTDLARSLQACAGLALLLVALVAAAVIAVATRAGLSMRREAIEIVHGLGAPDSYIAGRFARRATLLAAIGGAAGAVVALPVLLTLANLAAPFAGTVATDAPVVGTSIVTVLGSLPPALWLTLPSLPLAAAAIGFATAQGTVRRWLRRLP